MGRDITLDARGGGASSYEGIHGVLELTPTMMRYDGAVLVLPATKSFGVNNGKATLIDVAASPDGPEPAWAYIVTIRDSLTGRAWTETVGVPDGDGTINFTDLPRFTTTVPPEMSRGELQSFYDSTRENMELAVQAAHQAQAPTDEMNQTLLNDPLSLTAQAVGASIESEVAPVSASVDGASDPLAHLHHVDVFLSVIARPEAGYFAQAMSANESEGHLYIAFLATIGSERKIRIQRWDVATSTKVDESTATTSYINAGTEGIAWFRNSSGQLCFIIRGGTAGFEYQIFNYETGAIGSPITIQGAHKSAQEGNYFFTCSSGSAANGVDAVYVYDWESIKAGTPTLVQTIRLDIMPYPTKVQSFTVNNGYIILSHGAHKENAWVSVYDMNGRFVRIFGISPEQMLELGQIVKPDLNSLVNHESEGATVWKGQLLTGHALWNDDDTTNGPFVVLRHNVPSGKRLKTKTHVPTNPWTLLALSSGVTTGGTHPPAVIRDSTMVTLEGIVSGLSGGANVQIGSFDSKYAPRQTLRYTCPVIGASGYTASITISTGGVVTLAGTNHPSAASAPTTLQYQISHMWRAKPSV